MCAFLVVVRVWILHDTYSVLTFCVHSFLIYLWEYFFIYQIFIINFFKGFLKLTHNKLATENNLNFNNVLDQKV